MMKRKWTVLGALVASLLLAGIAVAAPGSSSIDWWVMGGGGGSGAAGSVALDATVGQAVAGVDGSGEYVVCAGFWYGLGPCGEPPEFTVYLPLVLRNAP
jgi:hypothetical protein